jgi:hypothetical protein
MATTGKGQTRSDFLRDLFQKSPGVSEKEAAQAWAAAGNEGTISSTSFYTAKLASKGGGSATTAASVKPKAKSASKGPKARPATKPTVEARPESNEKSAPSKPVDRSRPGDRERVLDRVEDGIDDLIIELKQLGGMVDALEALRRVRRVVVRSHQG